MVRDHDKVYSHRTTYLENDRVHIFVILSATFYNRQVTKHIDKTKDYFCIDLIRNNNTRS